MVSILYEVRVDNNTKKRKAMPQKLNTYRIEEQFKAL